MFTHMFVCCRRRSGSHQTSPTLEDKSPQMKQEADFLEQQVNTHCVLAVTDDSDPFIPPQA